MEPQAWWGIFERSGWGFAIGAPDGTLVATNPAFAEMHGYSVEELSGKPIATLLTPEWCEQLPKLMRAAHESGHLSLELVHARKDGTTFPVQTDVVVARDADGRVLYRYVWVQDITERKRAEEALQLIAEGTSSAIGGEFFRGLVKYLAHALRLRFGFVAELVDLEGGRVRLVSFWTGADYGETFEYSTKGTPCELVVGKNLAYFPAGVQELFPGDRWLQEMGIESYLAIPLFDSSGNPLDIWA